MSKIIIGTMLTVCAVLCVGYIIHRRNRENEQMDVKDVLKLQDILDWVDSSIQNIAKTDDSKLEVNVLPNSDSQKLTKHNDRRIYVALIKDGDKVLDTKTFYANNVDIDLESLKSDIVVIPIK